MKSPFSQRDRLIQAVSQNRMEREAARPIVERLLGASPDDLWDSQWPREWRTAGFVEELAMRAEAVRLTDPGRALAMAQLALAAVDGISLEQYVQPVRSRLEGIAWFSIGNAHYSDRAWDAALVAYAAAERSFAQERTLFHEEAAAKLARAAVHALVGAKEDAQSLLDGVAGILASIGDHRIQVMSQLISGLSHLRSGDLDSGRSIVQRVQRLPPEFTEWKRNSFNERVTRLCADLIAGNDSSALEYLPGLIADGILDDEEAGNPLELASVQVRFEELLRLTTGDAEQLIRTHPDFQTAALTKRLIEAAESETDVDPQRGFGIATLAVAAAESLSESLHSPETLAFLLGNAYRRMGISLYYGARYPEALEFYDRADRAFENSAAATYEKGRVAIHRTVTLVSLDRHDDAMASARQSQRAFSIFPDPPRVANGLFAEGYVLCKLREWRKALTIFEDIRERFGDEVDIDMQARIHSNIGLCHFQLDQREAAANDYYLAGKLFEQAGTRNEAARMHWQMASLVRAEGKIEESLRRFDEVAREFILLGMVGEAAGARLEAAETLLGIGEYERAAQLCRAALDQYQASGMADTQRAMTALAYLTEAARSSTVTPQLVRHVKEYLRRLPQEPALIFAPPPEPPIERE